MEFKSVSSGRLKRSLSYVIATTILNMGDGDFTQEKIVCKVRRRLTEEKIIYNDNIERLVSEKLKTMMYSTLITKHSIYFCLNC